MSVVFWSDSGETRRDPALQRPLPLRDDGTFPFVFGSRFHRGLASAEADGALVLASCAITQPTVYAALR